MKAPEITLSDREERARFIRERFRCIADCDQCGNCQVLHHQEAELVFADYTEGRRYYTEIMMSLRLINQAVCTDGFLFHGANRGKLPHKSV